MTNLGVRDGDTPVESMWAPPHRYDVITPCSSAASAEIISPIRPRYSSQPNPKVVAREVSSGACVGGSTVSVDGEGNGVTVGVGRNVRYQAARIFCGLEIVYGEYLCFYRRDSLLGESASLRLYIPRDLGPNGIP